MPVPSTGWLSVNQNQEPVEFDLPVAQVGTYQEGGDGIVTSGGSPTVTDLGVGGVSATIETGDDADLVDTLLLTLTRTQVFGVLIIDSFVAEDIPEPPVVCFPVNYTELADPAGLSCSGPALATPEFTDIRPEFQIVPGDECIPVGVLEPIVYGWVIGDGQDIGSGISIG